MSNIQISSSDCDKIFSRKGQWEVKMGQNYFKKGLNCKYQNFKA